MTTYWFKCYSVEEKRHNQFPVQANSAADAVVFFGINYAPRYPTYKIVEISMKFDTTIG